MAVSLTDKVDQNLDVLNTKIMLDIKAKIRDKFRKKIAEQVVDINIRRMRAQITRREQNAKEKELLAQQQREQQE